MTEAHVVTATTISPSRASPPLEMSYALSLAQTILPLPNDLPASAVKHVTVNDVPYIVSPAVLRSRASSRLPPSSPPSELSLPPLLPSSGIPLRRWNYRARLLDGLCCHAPVLARLPQRRQGRPGRSHRSGRR